jgi:uncharacterized protein YcnI
MRAKISRHAVRAAATLAATAGLLLAGAGVALAHVTVHPGEAAAGSWTKLTFQVPNESATADTVKLEVTLPTDHPFPSVSVMQIPGWTVEVTKTPLAKPVTEGHFNLTEAVSKITWTADDGAGIKPGEFMEFAISAGPVPDVPTIRFPADQTYSDSTVVSWNEKTVDGQEPEHPAPTLIVTGTATGGDAGSHVALSAEAIPGPDNTTRILAIVGVALGALALITAAIGLRRRKAGNAS